MVEEKEKKGGFSRIAKAMGDVVKETIDVAKEGMESTADVVKDVTSSAAEAARSGVE